MWGLYTCKYVKGVIPVYKWECVVLVNLWECVILVNMLGCVILVNMWGGVILLIMWGCYTCKFVGCYVHVYI